jgi:hypothetical protein
VPHSWLSWGTASPASAADEETAPSAAEQTVTPAVNDGPVFNIGEFVLQYLRENDAHPPIDELMQTTVELGRIETGYVRWREGVESVTITLAQRATNGGQKYHASALQVILETLRDEMGRRDILGVYVAPDPRQISEVGEDLRAADDTALTIIITTGMVTELRTLGSGERWAKRSDGSQKADPTWWDKPWAWRGELPSEDRVNHPVHARILRDSPIRPDDEVSEVDQSLLKRDALDNFLFHLSRHPGRRVDASVAAAQEVGGVALDYLVTENRPLVLYFQASNTGNSSTGYWRERFGLMHTQLTEHDDILSLDFITADFGDTNAFNGSYEAPVPGNDRIRWRVFGVWSEFEASDVGFFGDDFTGESWYLGGEVIANVYQDRELFVDVFGGVRFQNLEVNNPLLGTGEELFFIPRVGVRLDRTIDWNSTVAQAALEFHSDGITSIDDTDLALLGRTDADKDWVVLRFDARHATYLEPLLNYAAWSDPNTPESSTLAHELVLQVRGQIAFDNRLIPQEELVAGGIYTVRGYPEAAVAGDSGIIGTLEYRYHVPRAAKISPEPRELFGEPFRAAPQFVYGSPDWDLVLKTFLDVGQTYNSNKLSFEADETLVGIGVGVEFLYRRNLNVRVDWGFALEELENGLADDGANRLHVVATIFF